jgi:hypothetical protein
MKTTDHGNAFSGKFAKLIAEREADVAALKRAYTLLHARNGKGATSVLADALALDAVRREKRKPKRKPARAATKKTTGTHAATIAAQRRRTAKFLARMENTTGPYRGKDLQKFVTPLLRHGYIKKSGDGYVRTDKPFEP